jgi:hypothetical protein
MHAMVVGITIIGTAGGLDIHITTGQRGMVKIVKGYEAYIDALSNCGLTSVIGRWEGSQLGSAAIIIFVLAMV